MSNNLNSYWGERTKEWISGLRPIICYCGQAYNPTDTPINLYMKVAFLLYISGRMFGISLLAKPDIFFRFLA